MTTNTNTNNTFRQYLGTSANGAYVIRLRTRKNESYRNARIIASFTTHDAMCAAWDMCTTAEGMIDVAGTD